MGVTGDGRARDIKSGNVLGRSQYKLHMSILGSRSLVHVLVAVLVLVQCAAGDCSAANNATCGHGACEGYIIINDVCTSICGTGTYYDPSTAMCLSCRSLGPVSCSTLCPGFYFAPSSSNSTNSTNGTAGTNSTNGTNSSGPSTCQACSGAYGLTCRACTASSCTECAEGHQLAGNGQGCVATNCNITNCVQCSGTTGCYLCEAGYAVSKAGNSCIPVGCSVGYCSLCSGTSCLACIAGYHLSSSGCQPICDIHCINCVSPGVCANCEGGYALDTKTYTCYLNCSAGFDGHCVACENLLYCTTCQSGYVPALNGAICQPVFTCTDPHCSSCSIASLCTVCNTGYFLSSGKCHKDICFIPACTACSSVSTCDTCARNYVLNSDKSACEPACAGKIPECLECNSSTTCHACNLGYTLANNKCEAACKISGCELCLTNTTCLICKNGLLPSDDFTSCNLICNDPNCYICNTTASCLTCVTGYSTSHGGICFPNCRQGSALNANGVCQQCRHSLSNCQSCAFDSSNNIACIRCAAGYYQSSGTCFSCKAVLPNCRLCNQPNSCSLCNFGFSLSTSGACLGQNCKAKNCQLCEANSTSRCATCSTGFAANANGNCQVSCKTGESLINGVCQCPLGAYLPQAGAACTPCADSNCLLCTVNVCSSCVQGFYPSGGSCLPCMANCFGCFEAATCAACQPPYVYSNGSCQLVGSGFSAGITPSGNVFTCDPGCDTCGRTPTGTMVCLTVLSGYSQVNGNIIKCDATCKTCSAATASDCLSCYSGNSLSGGVCLNCTDPNALTCSPTDATFSLTCAKGFTAVIDNSASPSTSRCRLCAPNCYRCDAAGAGACDAGQCENGYVQQPGNTNCTQCFGGCSICDPTNLMSCLSCGPRRYTDPASGSCTGCPTGCQNCNSSQVCTSCFPNYMMVGTLCTVSPTWPCIQSSNGACTACVEDFSVKGGACEYSSNCSATASCSNCPYGYYLTNVTSNLQGICSPCPTISNCLTCNPTSPNTCFLCKNGYYVSGTGSCITCEKGCAECTAADFCTLAKDGYYLVSGANGSPSGIAGVCAAPCQTCENTPFFCLSCMEGSSISGSTCFSDKVAYVTIVFNLAIIFGENDTFEVAYGKVMNNIGYFRTTMCANLPKLIRDLDPTCRTNFNFIKFARGSLSCTTAMDISKYKKPSDATDDITKANLLPPATIISTSVTTPTNNPNDSSNSNSNLGLILGVSIPLGLLLLTIIGIVIYSKNSGDKEAEIDESGKPIEYDNIQGPERPRQHGRNLKDADIQERVDRL